MNSNITIEEKIAMNEQNEPGAGRRRSVGSCLYGIRSYFSVQANVLIVEIGRAHV